MYVETWVNRRAARNTIVNSETTQNFMAKIGVKSLNILWHQDTGKMKLINLVALLVLGVAKGTPIKLKIWIGQTNFVVVKMDDFDIVLGMDFLLKQKVIPMPLTKCLVVTRSNPTIIQTNTRQLKGIKLM